MIETCSSKRLNFIDKLLDDGFFLFNDSLEIVDLSISVWWFDLQIFTWRISLYWSWICVSSLLGVFSFETLFSPMRTGLKQTFVKEGLFCLAGLLTCLRPRNDFLLVWWIVDADIVFTLVFIMLLFNFLFTRMTLEFGHCNRITSFHSIYQNILFINYIFKVSDLFPQVIDFLN